MGFSVEGAAGVGSSDFFVSEPLITESGGTESSVVGRWAEVDGGDTMVDGGAMIVAGGEIIIGAELAAELPQQGADEVDG